MLRSLFTYSLLLVVCSSFGQTTLRIKCSDTGQPPVYSELSFRGKNKRVKVDSTGIAHIRSSDTLKAFVSSLGYADYEVTLLPKTNLNISLLKDYQYLKGAVVLDQFKPGSLEKSISNVKVINRKTIEQMGAADLNDVISRQLNIRISQDNSLGSTQISLMGISGQNIKVMIDGVPINGRLLDQLDLSQVNLQDIERIEIVKGPMSIAYGTNALGGAINLITKKYINKPLSGNVQVLTESAGKLNVNASIAKRKKQNVYRLSVGRNLFDGWSVNDTDRTFDWMPKRQYFARAQFVRKIPKGEIQLRIDGMNEYILDRGLPFKPYEERAIDQTFTTNRFDQSLYYSRLFNKKHSFNLLVGNNIFTRVKNKYIIDLTTLDRVLAAEQSEQDTQRYWSQTLRSVYSFTGWKKVSLQAGIDGLMEQVDGSRIKGENQGIIDGGLFITSIIQPVSKLFLKPSVRINYNSQYKSDPVLAFQTRWKPARTWIVKASISTGYRAPSVKELYLNFVDNSHNVVGNENLRAENSFHTRFSITKAISINKKTNLTPELEIFTNKINDQIQLVFTGETSAIYENIGLFESKGFNFSLPFTANQFRATLAYGWNNINNGLSPSSQFNGAHDVSTNLSYQYKKWVFSGFSKFQGEQVQLALNNDDEVAEFKQASYQLIDVSITRQALLKNTTFVTFGIKNLMNVTNIASQNTGGAHQSAVSSVPLATGRQYFAKLTYTLQRK